MTWGNVILRRIDAERLLAAAHALASIRRFEEDPQVLDHIYQCEWYLTVIEAKVNDHAPGDLLRYASDMLAECTLADLEALDRFETARMARTCIWWGDRGAARLLDRSLR